MKIKRNVSPEELVNMMRDWLKIYLPNIRFRSQNTIDSYESSLNLYLDFLEKNKQITEKNISEKCFCQQWIEEWISEAHIEKKNSKRTCNVRLSCMRSLLQYLSSKNILFLPYYHDSREIKKLARGHGRKVEGLSKHATAELFAAMKVNDSLTYRDRVFFTLMYDTGARVSEIRCIRIKDLVLENESPYAIICGKGEKYRTVLFSPETVKLLKRFISDTCGRTPWPDGYLFYSRTKGRGTPISIDAINCRLKVYAKKAHERCPEIPVDMHTHQIRHSVCTHMHQDNINLAKISTYLGHQSIETTRIYLGISKEDLAEALAKREPVMSGYEAKYINVKGGLRSLLAKR
jgi:site-specific recombinase XerD